MVDVRLMQGDCLEMMDAIEAGSVDMILTDLPYGVTGLKWDLVIPFEPLWEQYKRVIKPGGAIVLFGSQPFTSALITSNLEWFKYCWYWEKPKGTNFASTGYQPLKVVEEVAIFSSKPCTYTATKAGWNITRRKLS
jgi:site-specific DNA-methyltransferase (adenine-specific)